MFCDAVVPHGGGMMQSGYTTKPFTYIYMNTTTITTWGRTINANPTLQLRSRANEGSYNECVPTSNWGGGRRVNRQIKAQPSLGYGKKTISRQFNNRQTASL